MVGIFPTISALLEIYKTPKEGGTDFRKVNHIVFYWKV